jgi:hypothetical protein
VSRRFLLPALFLVPAAVLVPWLGWLVISLPCRYVSRHWGVAWAGLDTGLAIGLAFTGLAAIRRASWIDRVAVATATLLAADAWFDVLTSRGAAALAVAVTQALAIELPLAALCIWVAHSVTTSPSPARSTTATTTRQGALS